MTRKHGMENCCFFKKTIVNNKMSSSYASLQNYNEDYGYCPGKMIRTEEIETEQFQPEEDHHSLPILIDCLMEGTHFEPTINTTLSANLTIVVLEHGFMFLLKVRRGKHITSACLQFVDQNDELGDHIIELYHADGPTEALKSGILSKGLVLFHSSEFPMSRKSFLHHVDTKIMMASISTRDFHDGEVAGLLVRHDI